MKFAVLLALLVPLALAAAAQTKIDGGAKPAGGAVDPNVYSGKSADGNLQAALADALSKAQTGANKGGADVQFNWELAKVSGKRGGIAGTQEVVVDVRIVK